MIYNDKMITNKWLWVLGIVFVMVVYPVIIRDDLNIYDHRDEQSYHLQTIKGFRNQFPNIDLSDYRSATTPLYHVGMTLSSFVVGVNIFHLRVVNSAIGLLCLMVFCYSLKVRGDGIITYVFLLLMFLSSYFLGPTVRLSTDNLALLFAMISVLVLSSFDITTKNLWFVSVMMTACILTRQVYVWLLGAYFIQVVIRSHKKDLLKHLLPLSMPVICLSFFLWLWGGLTPPSFETAHSQGLNWQVPIYIVSMIGFFSIFFFGWFIRIYNDYPKLFFLRCTVLVGVMSIYLFVFPVSSEYPLTDHTRGGWLWLMASKIPELYGTSILFWMLSPIGIASLYLSGIYLIKRREYMLTICTPLWIIANMMNVKVYQKYYELLAIFFLGYVIVSIQNKDVRWFVGPIVLLGAFLLVAVNRFYL